MKSTTQRTKVAADATIRFALACYRMGDLNAMRHHIKRGNLAKINKNTVQKNNTIVLEKLANEMALFELEYGRGSCLQLQHQAVVNLISADFYPRDVIRNARKATWHPTFFQFKDSQEESPRAHQSQ